MMKSKTKLMIVFHDMALGGIQRKVIDIIKKTQNLYPETDIVVCLRNKKGIFLKDIPHNIPVLSPSFHTTKLDMVWFTIWLTIEILKHNPTTILSFMDLGSIPTLTALKLLFWKNTRVVIGEDILTSKYVYTETRPKLRLKLIKYFYPSALKILVQTKIQKQDLIGILNSKNKIVVSPNWLPLNFPPKNYSSTKTRQIDILFIGRIEAQKNLPKLIQIIKLLVTNHPSLKVKIIGSGSQEKNIKKLVKQQRLTSNISFLPATSCPEKYYSSSKIFILTSDYEGFPLTLLEAISCGCYPIVNHLPEIIQFFDKDPQNFIFQNTDSAVKLIEKTLNNFNNKSLDYYQQKVLSLQEKNILNYLKFIRRKN